METDLAGYLRLMPDYREPLVFVQRLLNMQAGLAELAEPGLSLEPSAARARWQAGQPLLTGTTLTVPAAWRRESGHRLRDALPAGSDAIRVLDRILSEDAADRWSCEAIVTGYETRIQQIADATGADASLVDFMLTAVLSPFFDKQAAPYRAQIDAATWRRGICPVCGCAPWMARLVGESGQRVLACALCHTEWNFDRLRCPFCQSNDRSCSLSESAPRLRYFTVDGDEIRRAYCCEQCKRYIKTIDERAMSHRTNLLAEDVVSARLDQLAQQHGYR